MTKDTLVRKLKEKTDLESVAAAEKVYEAIIDSMTEALGSGEDVGIRGFGTFSVVNQPARSGRNPRTGESLVIPAGRKIKFSPGNELKEAAKAMASGTAAEWLKHREFLRGFEGQIEDFRKKLADYRARSEHLGSDAKALYKENVERLSSVMEEARYKFTLLKSGGGGALDELKKGFEGAFSELKAAFHRAKDKF